MGDSEKTVDFGSERLGGVGTSLAGRFLESLVLGYPSAAQPTPFSPTGAYDPSNFSTPLSGLERLLTSQLINTNLAGSPVEASGTEFLRSLLSGETLFGGSRENPYTRPILEQVERTAAESTNRSREAFLGQARGILGGRLRGASTVLPELAAFERGAIQAETDSINRALAGFEESERNRQVQAAGLVPTFAGLESGRIERALSAAGVPRQISDVGLTRAIAENARVDQATIQGIQAALGPLIGVGGTTLPPDTTGSSIGSGLGSLVGIIALLASLCWALAQYTGWYTPAWFAGRRWLLEGWRGEKADAFRELYRERGIRLARRIRENDEIRRELAPFFAWAVAQGSEMAEAA